MYRNSYVLYLLVLTLAALGGCSSGPSDKGPAKVAAATDKIQGKAQVLVTEPTASDAALNAGGPTVFLWDGLKRYRLFFNKAISVEHGKQYVAEGVYAQKAIDAIGDPDQGKNGYPLPSSCDHVVRTTWPGLAFDVSDADVTSLCATVKRYPARPIFLVTRLTPAPETAASKKEAEDQDMAEVSVPAEKQRALLMEGPASLPAPLWEPAGGTVRCRVFITDGKVSDLDTGAQLCETVPWSQFRYQPMLKGGHPVRVKTEVEVRFEPRK